MACGHVSDHRYLVHRPLMQFGDGKFFRSSGHQSGALLRHDGRDEAGPLQQFDPHSISRIELLPLVTRLGIIHPRIGEDAVYVGCEQFDFTQEACGRILPGFQLHTLITIRRAERSGKENGAPS